MSLHSKIENKLNEALKAKDKKTYPTLRLVVSAIKDVEIKAQASVIVPDIQTSYNLGDRFKFGREIDFVNCDMIARSIT